MLTSWEKARCFHFLKLRDRLGGWEAKLRRRVMYSQLRLGSGKVGSAQVRFYKRCYCLTRAPKPILPIVYILLKHFELHLNVQKLSQEAKISWFIFYMCLASEHCACNAHHNRCWIRCVSRLQRAQGNPQTVSILLTVDSSIDVYEYLYIQVHK
jgi:hypothetical protein